MIEVRSPHFDSSSRPRGQRLREQRNDFAVFRRITPTRAEVSGCGNRCALAASTPQKEVEVLVNNSDLKKLPKFTFAEEGLTPLYNDVS